MFRRATTAAVLLICGLWAATAARAAVPAALADRIERTQDALIDAYDDASAPFDRSLLALPADLSGQLGPAARRLLASTAVADPSMAFGELRAHAQQAAVLEMAAAVRDGRVADAQAWRAILDLPRGVSANDGGVLLANLPAGAPQRADAARALVREAITWQTTRVRQLLADAANAAAHPAVPMPGRLAEQLGEAVALAAVPGPLRSEAGLTGATLLDAQRLQTQSNDLLARPWAEVAGPLLAVRREIETHLPSLLTDAERQRRERLLLKLVTIIPTEYRSGVGGDRQVKVPLEYREAVSFTAQARQYADELTPIWLADPKLAGPQQRLESALEEADRSIAAKADPDAVAAVLKAAQQVLQDDFHLSLRRGGTTADIVDEVMVETRSLLNQSLAAATTGHWADAEDLRLQAYTTYDPDLEARLMPRDPQLATDIEHLILDGLDKPGVKALLDHRADPAELEAAYTRVDTALDRASALLKSGVSPTAAAFNAGSIVLREGLEGLLVIVAILAGLRGDENRHKRHLIWYGVLLSMVATGITVVLSQTVITRLRGYSEVIEAITSILAIGVLMLITNWLFQQVYWKQWVTSLKTTATDGGAWQLITVGFLIGYREGFETVLFIQSLVMDAGGGPVALGVFVGVLALTALGASALLGGLRLPYFQLLLITAGMIGMVLVMFVGTGVRAMQTVGWLPVHKLADASWPAWVGSWLGVYNSAETIGGQLLAILIVLGTWRWSRWQSKRASQRRRAVRGGGPVVAMA